PLLRPCLRTVKVRADSNPISHARSLSVARARRIARWFPPWPKGTPISYFTPVRMSRCRLSLEQVTKKTVTQPLSPYKGETSWRMLQIRNNQGAITFRPQTLEGREEATRKPKSREDLSGLALAREEQRQLLR